MAKNSEGRSGGLIVLWRRGSFSLLSVFQGNNYLGVEGVWGNEQLGVTIVNVYAPCDLRGKRMLWGELLNQIESRGSDRWCVMGDFNSIKSPEERKGVDGFDRSEEM